MEHTIGIETESFTAYYDETQSILFVRYHGQVTPAVSAQYYQWLMSIIKENPERVGSARGSIYDFRDVKEVATSNMSSAQRQSQQVNQQADLQNHPVAVIARDTVQHGQLSVTMKISPQSDRKRIVRSDAEALAFIDAFHRKQEHSPQS